MDGTLIDQTGPILRCFTDVITALGYPEPPEQEIRRNLGGPMAATMELFVDADHLDQACSSFRKRFPQLMYEGLEILPGALGLIEYFSSRNVPQGILTNKHGPTARLVSEHCGFSRFIPVCIGNTDTEWAKPDPELTRHVFEKMGASLDGAVLIGDSPTDAESARRVGISFFGVATGAHSSEELKSAGAELAVDNLFHVNVWQR